MAEFNAALCFVTSEEFKNIKYFFLQTNFLSFFFLVIEPTTVAFSVARVYPYVTVPSKVVAAVRDELSKFLQERKKNEILSVIDHANGVLGHNY